MTIKCYLFQISKWCSWYLSLPQFFFEKRCFLFDQNWMRIFLASFNFKLDLQRKKVPWNKWIAAIPVWHLILRLNDSKAMKSWLNLDHSHSDDGEKARGEGVKNGWTKSLFVYLIQKSKIFFAVEVFEKRNLILNLAFLGCSKVPVNQNF